MIKSFAESIDAQLSSNWFYDEGHIVFPLFNGEVNGKRVTFAVAPEGSGQVTHAISVMQE